MILYLLSLARSTTSRSCFALACLLFLTRGASAATLTGQITDPDGRGVGGAHVVVSNLLGVAAEGVTSRTGSYEIANIAAGEYHVRVVSDGFQVEPADITLTADEHRELALQLRVTAIAESIVVSASQIDVPLSQTPDSVTVISAAELQARQIETAADALRQIPGLSATRSGGRGAITSLFPRGGGSNYTLVLVDGIRVNAFGGGYDFAHLPVSDVEQIEVVRGPQSALFGSDAIGGVVRVATRRGGPARIDGIFEGGGFGTVRAAFAAAGSAGNWSWGGGAERTRSDGFSGRAANGERVTNDDYELTHLAGSLGWKAPSGDELLVATQVNRDERGFPGPFGSDPIGVFDGVDRISHGVNDTRQIGGRFGHLWSPRIRQRLDASYTDLEGTFVSRFDPAHSSHSGTRRADGRIQEDFALASQVGASVGAEFTRERGSSTFITGASATPIPIERGVVGTFAEVRLSSRERLFGSGGVRLERLTRDAVEADPNSFSPRPVFPSQTVNSVNPKIAASYALARSGSGRAVTRLRASAGTGIRPPDAFEIAFTDNPDLKPERSRSVDFGIEQQLGAGAYQVAATAFLNRYDNLIVTVGRSLRDASRYRTDNISNARARGVELSGAASLPRGLAINASYTFLSTRILSVDGLERLAPAPFAVGDPLIRRPRHQSALAITYKSSRVSAFAELGQRSRILDIEPNFGSFGGLFYSPGYSVVNAGTTLPIGSHLQLFVRGLNLADRKYEETLGYPALGRSAMAGIRVAAGR